MKAMGYNSIDDLEHKIKDSVRGEAYENWKKVTDTLNKLKKVNSIIWEVCSIAAAVGIVVIATGALGGVIGIAAAVAALGVLSDIVCESYYDKLYALMFMIE